MLDFQEILQLLLRDPEIEKCRLRRDDNEEDLIHESMAKSSNDLTNPRGASSKTETPDPELAGNGADVSEDITNYIDKMEGDEEDDGESLQTVSFEVKQEEIENSQRQCILLEYPLLVEYDFKNDNVNPNIK